MKKIIDIKFSQYLVIIILLTMFDCTSTGKKELFEKVAITRNKDKIQEDTKKKEESKKTENTETLNSKDIVPQSVLDYLKINLSGWEIPDTSEYVKYWWAFNDRTKTTYFVNTDLNMDGIEDYAILMETANELKLVFILRKGNTFSHWVADDFSEPYSGTGLKHGIYIKNPGRTDCVVEHRNVSLILEQNGIELRKEEIMIRIYYRKNGEFKIFNTR